MTRVRSLLLLMLGLAVFHDGYAQTAWERYVSHPTSSNAKAVKRVDDYSASARASANFQADLEILENQVLAGDREAVRLVFRAAMADRVLEHYLYRILGRLARVNARVFLEELQRSGSKDDPAIVVGTTGEAYADRLAARAHELRARAAALQQIPDRGLVELRDKCVGILQERAATLEALSSSAFRSQVAILDAWLGPRLVRSCTRHGPQAEKFWDPKFDEIMAAERRLPLYLERARDCGTSLHPVNRYLRQYVGIVVNGRRLLYLNAFEAENYTMIKKLVPEIANWRTHPYDKCHAGMDHWGVEYDVEKEAFANLICNYGPPPGRESIRR
jgi:hypothetical protein